MRLHLVLIDDEDDTFERWKYVDDLLFATPEERAKAWREILEAIARTKRDYGEEDD